MKRVLALALGLVLVLALATTGLAADVKWTLKGKINANMIYGQNPDASVNGYRLTGQVTDLQADLRLANVKNGDNPSLSITFAAAANNNRGADTDFGNGAFAQGTRNVNIQITNAVATFKGAYWKNGPELTTEIGSRNAHWSDYVSGAVDYTPFGDQSADGDGIVISDIPAGPVSARVAHLFLDNAGDRVTVANLSGGLGGFDTEFTVASHYVKPALTVMVNDIHVGISGDVADGVSLEANYATDGLNNGYVYDVEGELSTLPGISLTAGIRGVDQARNWSPRFAARDHNKAGCQENDGELCAHDTRNGINLGVSTTQAGVDLGLTYTTGEDPTDPDDGETVTKVTAGTTVSDVKLSGGVTMTTLADSVADKTKYELKASKSFGSVNGSYSFSTETTGGVATPRVIHTFAADTKIDTPLADGVKISGQLKLDSNFPGGGAAAKPQLHTSAEWEAPNGLALGLHYANYNRKDHGPVPGDGPGSAAGEREADGFYATAEYSLTF